MIHWNRVEGEARARLFAAANLDVLLEYDHRAGPSVLRSLRDRPPSAVIVGLDRLPSQGRDVGVALRTFKETRRVPLVFVGGAAEKVARIRQSLPDATYSEWTSVVADLKRALVKPSGNPVVPASKLAGYSGTPLPRKLGIKPGSTVALLNPPEAFFDLFSELPPGVLFTHRLDATCTLALWFARSAGELTEQVQSIAVALGDRRLWICWPKRTSPLATDLSENIVRAAGLGVGLVDFKVAAIDADWSGLFFAPRRKHG